MAERPPDEPNLPWDEIAKQVQSALQELDLDSPDTQSRLMGELQSMMSSLDGLGFPVDLTPPISESPSPPDISVVEGGLESSTEREPAEARPDLKVAPDPETDEVEAKEEASEHPSQASAFKWFSLGDFPGGTDNPLPSVSAAPGRIHLSGTDAETGAQTIFHGSTSATYRITAESGCLRIVLDGKSADTLSKGRSIDVEGTVIRVLLEQAERAEGSYQRIC